MNLPNKITVFRVCLIPFFLIFLLVPSIPYGKFVALGIFVVASLSDFVDGYLARKNNLITNFGKLMDPLADKLLVSSALICFVELKLLPAWIVIIIIARDFIINGIRLIASDNQVVIAASYFGKYKTTAQMILCVLLIANIDGTFFYVLEQIFIYISLVLTVVSLVDYIIKNRKILTEGSM